MNYQKICIGCMREKENDHPICPYCGMDVSKYRVNPWELPPFTILQGKYLVGKVLGAGGFGITYIAYDMKLKRKRAVKEFYIRNGVMSRNSEVSKEITITLSDLSQNRVYEASMKKFEQEAQTLAQSEEMEGIVKVYDYFNENGTAYIVMEFLDGMTLKDYVIHQGGKLPFSEVKEKVRPVMHSLEELHQNGILHRDISPDNIMVMEDGKTMKLFDFGGAKDISVQGVNSSMVMQKKGYSPTEQIANTMQGPWTDIYALAATMYYCICGKAPEDAAARAASVNDSLLPPGKNGAEITAKEEIILLKALSLHRENRYQTVCEFEEALNAREEKNSEKELAIGYLKDHSEGSLREPLKDLNPKRWLATLVLLVFIVTASVVATRFTMNNQQNKNQKQSLEEGRTENKVQIENESLNQIKEPEKQTEKESRKQLEETQVIDWKDEKLEAAMREITGITDREILYSDVKNITELYLDEKGITDISALSDLLNLKELYLRKNQISDISALSNLTNLTKLYIWGNQINDISALSNLIKLTGLYLAENQIRDISALSNLTNLKELRLGGNQISDISALSNLTNLTELYLWRNQISDIGALSNLTKLRVLDLRNNQISDYSPIERLKTEACYR